MAVVGVLTTYREEYLLLFYVIIQLIIDTFPLLTKENIKKNNPVSPGFFIACFVFVWFAYLMAGGIYLISQEFIYPAYGENLGRYIGIVVYAAGYNLTELLVKNKDPKIYQNKLYARVFVYTSGAVITFFLFTVLTLGIRKFLW